MKQMTKTLLGTLGIAAVAVALGLLAVSVGKDEEKKTEQKEKSARLFELDKAKVRELRLLRAGVLVAGFKREAQDAAWKIVAPVQTDADDQAVAAMVDKLAELKQKSELDGLDAKTVGLGDEQAAKFAVTATEEGGKASVLWVGEDNPFDQSLYVKKGPEALVRVVTAGDKAPFEKTLFDLRDKRVAHLADAAEVRKLTVAPRAPHPGTFTYALEKDGADWKLLAPDAGGNGKADGTTVDKVIALVKGLRATAVVDESASAARLAELGLSAPTVTVTLAVQLPGQKEGFTRTLLLAQPAPAKGQVAVKTYAKRDDSAAVFEVDNGIVKDLGRELFELQDKTVLKFSKDDVAQVAYEANGKPPVVIARKKEALADGGVGEEVFTVAGKDGQPVKKWKVSGNLFALASLKAAAFAGKAPKDAQGLARFGLDLGRTVRISGAGDKLLGKLWVGNETPDQKRLYALAEGGADVVEIEKATLDDLTWKAEDALEPPPAPPAAPAPPATGADGGAK